MVPSPIAAQQLELRAPPRVQHSTQPMTVYLAFDGPVITYGDIDDSRTNTSYLDRAAIPYAPYGDATAQAALVQAVLLDWSPYDVTITESRPAVGDYVMTVVSPTNPYAGEAAGIAPLDCDDTWTRNNVVFAFHGANDGYAINEQARTVGQEVAHSIGLEHTTVDEDVMSYAYGPGDFWFVDQCSQILLTAMSPEVTCTTQHLAFCGAAQQNSHAELVAMLGTSAPDTQSPTITISAPTNGESYDEGDDFMIHVNAADERGVAEVQLFSNGEPMANDVTEPYGWPVTGIPAGQYELYAEARDAAGNIARSDIVTIQVTPLQGPDANAESSGEGSSSGDEPLDPDPDDEVDEDPDALPPGYGLDRSGDEGCTIASDRASPLLLVLAPLLRRRRRAA
ncbi:MAG TPA: Ig-like domain-containing protein [Nannocystaceae bacterium]|nr:Ig-like domain-containing protein [Nannocystaceae bacterium]